MGWCSVLVQQVGVPMHPVHSSPPMSRGAHPPCTHVSSTLSFQHLHAVLSRYVLPTHAGCRVMVCMMLTSTGVCYPCTPIDRRPPSLNFSVDPPAHGTRSYTLISYPIHSVVRVSIFPMHCTHMVMGVAGWIAVLVVHGCCKIA